MPFFHEFDDAYQPAIKPASEAAVLMQSAWTSRFHEEHSGPGLNQIAKADVVIADLSDRNPNVF